MQQILRRNQLHQHRDVVQHNVTYLLFTECVARATPSSQKAPLNLPSVPLVNECTLDSLDHGAIRRQSFWFLLSNGIQEFIHSLCRKDGQYLSSLKLLFCNGGSFTPHFCSSLVMSCINISITLFSLYGNDQSIYFSPQQCSDMLVGVVYTCLDSFTTI